MHFAGGGVRVCWGPGVSVLAVITAENIEPAKWFAGLVGFMFAGFAFDIGIAFLMRGSDEAVGDERN